MVLSNGFNSDCSLVGHLNSSSVSLTQFIDSRLGSEGLCQSRLWSTFEICNENGFVNFRTQQEHFPSQELAFVN